MLQGLGLQANDGGTLSINKHDNMYRQYMTVYNYYLQKLGTKIAVFLQCGEFYELYSCGGDESDSSKSVCSNAFELADIMNIAIVHKKSAVLSETNPWKAGFPRNSTNKFRNILLANNYAIIFCDEVPSDTTPKQRVVADVVTPGVAPSVKTYHANNVICLFIEHQNPKLVLGENNSREVKETRDPNVVDTPSLPGLPATRTARRAPENTSLRFDKLEIIVGAAAIDVTTNESYVFEVSSTYETILKGESNSLEEIYRFVRSNRCRELSIHFKGFIFGDEVEDSPHAPQIRQKLKKYFVETLGLDDYYVHDIGMNDVPNEWCSPKYINSVLSKVFKASDVDGSGEESTKTPGIGTTPLEYLEMTYMMNAATAFVILLEYIRVRNATLMFGLNKVKHWKSNDRLILTHNAQQQLGLVSSEMMNYGRRNTSSNKPCDQSLFEILDHTSTPMGKRLLEMTLLQPFADSKLLQKKYDDLSVVMKTMPKSGDILQKTLREIVDLQRFHRKLELKMLPPKGLARLISSYYAIKRLFVLALEDVGLYVWDGIRENRDEEFRLQEMSLLFSQYLELLTSTFNTEKLMECKSFKNVSVNVFQKGVSDEIDELGVLAAGIDQYAAKIAKDLAALLNVSEDKIKVEIPAKGGRYFKVPHSVRGALIFYRQLLNGKNGGNETEEGQKEGSQKTSVPKYPTIEDLYKMHKNEINDAHFQEWGSKIKSKGAASYPTEHLTTEEIKLIESCGKFNALKSTAKVYCKLIEDAELSSESVIDNFSKAMTHIYLEYSLALYNMNSNMLEKVTTWVANLDVLKSNAFAAFEGRYVCPTVVEGNVSYIRGKNLRHPIIEIIHDDVSFVGNDVNLGFKHEMNEKIPHSAGSSNGMFLHSINNGGKTTYLKSVGLNLLMAQCGMFVPADSFEYVTFGNIITRLSGNDNMSRRQGSFAVEMAELRTVMNQSGPKTLVLGDEICRGTEQKSALAIVAAAAVKLCERRTNFIFSTHLRTLSDLEEIQDLTITGIGGLREEVGKGGKMEKVDSFVPASSENPTNTLPSHVLLKHYHFKTIQNGDQIIFEYKLREGMGASLYGIEIAEMMGLDPSTCALAYRFRNIIENPDTYDVPIGGGKKSRYNSKLLNGICEIEGCGKPVTETHHIRHQSEADESGFIDHFHKDSYFNLVGLCEKHHHEQHHGTLKIVGKAQTSTGVKLLFG